MSKNTLFSKGRFVTFVTAVVTACTFIGPVAAHAAVEDSTAAVDYYEAAQYDETMTAVSRDCEVSASRGSEFIITIPKKIVLDGQGEADYEVTVDADLAGCEVISVIPTARGEGFILTEKGGKASIGYIVTQEKQFFIAGGSVSTGLEAEMELSGIPEGNYVIKTREAATTFGTISAPSISAGDWSGVFDFAIALSYKG